MIKVQSQRGEISISSAVFTSITGAAATNCFGVKGMAYRSMTDGLVHLLRREAMSKGVKVTYNEDGTVSIELHIIVENGVNIATALQVRQGAGGDGRRTAGGGHVRGRDHGLRRRDEARRGYGADGIPSGGGQS